MRSVILTLLALSTIITSAHSADGLIPSPEPDWPQWRGPYRNGISEEKGLLQTWPEGGPQLLWKVEGLGKGWSSPIIVGNRIYITGDLADDLVIFAFDRNGKEQWRTKNGKSWKRSFPGARAACVYSEGRIYNMNAHGRIACVDANSGDEVWHLNILDQFEGKNITWAVSECLLVDGPRLIATPGGKKALMVALDKRNGKIIWTTPPLAEDNATHSPPILFKYEGIRIIANCSSAHGFGVNADTGKLLYTVPLKNRFGTNCSPPIYDSGRIFYVTPYGEHGRAYNLRLTKDNQVTADHAWTNMSLDTVTGAGVLLDGTLFSAGYKKDKWWFAVDWQTGKTKYQLKDFTTGAPIHADNRLYILDEKGKVGLLKINPEKLEIKGQFNLTNKRVNDAWAHPVILDKKLYLRYHDTLYCYDVKNNGEQL